MNHIIKSCGAVVFARRGKEPLFLIIRQNNGDCGFPKGHMEPGETEAEAAVREVREETGGNVTLREGFCETVEYAVSPRTKKRVVLFLAEMTAEPNVQPEEICGYRWVSAEEMKTMLRKVIAPAIDKAEAYLK